MNAHEIKQRLAAQAEAVCRELLPGGKRQGHEWVAGDVSGGPGQSLKVHLDGERAGLWSDFANPGQSGDLLDLWAHARNLPLPEVLAAAKRWLGVLDSAPAFRPKAAHKPFRAPSRDGIRKLEPTGEVCAYLTQSRGIDAETLARYSVAETSHPKHGPTIVFPCHEPSGKDVELVKFLAVNRPDGKKVVWSSPDSRDHLFGWKAIPPDAREVVITEGEIDALTVAGWGFPALSIPRGVKSFDWLENDFDALERFESVYICTDSDEPGRECARVIAERLGAERCRLVTLGSFKDANEALMSGSFVGPDFADAIAKAASIDPEGLCGPREYDQAVEEVFWPSSPKAEGTETPIGLPWRIRPGELTVWTGFSGHGKTLLLLQFLAHDASQGERVCLASLEIDPADTIADLVRMVLGRAPKDRAELQKALAWIDGRFWFLKFRGHTNWRKIIPLFEYAARRYGCTRFAVDSLLFCGVPSDDYAGQKEFVSELIALAVRTRSHVHLVAHSRKQEDESRAPGKLDVKGASDITDMAHNGVTVWRNKAKERQLEEARISKAPPAQIIALERGERDATIQMWKNRKGGDEPFRSLWLHRPSKTFRRDESEPAGKPYAP